MSHADTSQLQYWPAPAKLNLFLHITGRRDDGYHELQTVFQFLDYSDQLAFELRDDGLIRRVTDIEGVPAEQDLMVKAARLLQQTTGTTAGVDIHINKILPMGGGLGGGSSDAATVLVVLNQLWSSHLSQAELAELGLSLGADLPVFVYGHSAFAEGVGECLKPVDPPELWYLVVHPQIHVATGVIFNDSRLTRDCSPIRICDLSEASLTNVCEAVAIRQYPPIAEALAWLTEYSPARMTGTGACVFAAFNTRQQAEAVLDQLPTKWQGFVARGVNVSPLHSQLEKYADSI